MAGTVESGRGGGCAAVVGSIFRGLIASCEARLGSSPRGISEEDIASSVFGSIVRGVAEGRFENISTRDELWWLLLNITKRKTVDHIRRETASCNVNHHAARRSIKVAGSPFAAVGIMLVEGRRLDIVIKLPSQVTSRQRAIAKGGSSAFLGQHDKRVPRRSVLFRHQPIDASKL